VRSRSSRTSDTPVASELLPRACARGSLPGRQGRFLRPSVKMRRCLRPEVPFIAGGHSRTRVNRCRSRGAVTCVPATIRPSPPLRSRLPRPGFRLAAGYRSLDPRPRPPCAPRFLTERRRALLWVRLRPTTSATPLSTRGHALEHPTLAFLPVCPAVFAGTDETLRFGLATPVTARRPSPVEEGLRTLRAATTPPTPTPDALQARTKDIDPGLQRSIATPLAGDASTRPPFAAVAVERRRWIAQAG